jgi:hypothetical protein
MKLFTRKYVKVFVFLIIICIFTFSNHNHFSMKKACILVVFCLLAGMLLSSCHSSKTCPAYRSVSYVEQPASTTQPG